MANKESELASPERTTLSLSLTVEDKKALKVMAAERGTTIAAIIHQWISANREGSNTRDEGGVE